jgi:effector-binding domain-containing protein
MAIYHEQLSDEQRGLVEVCWPIAGDLQHLPDGVELKQQSATEVAYIVVSLDESADIGQKYDAVFTWIGQQGRTVAGPPRENYLAKRDTIEANDPYIEIDVPIA